MSVMTEQRQAQPVEFIPPRVLRGTLPDGRQVLVTLWDEETGEVAFRDGDNERWGRETPVTKP